MEKRGLGDKILKAGFLVFVAHLCLKLAGFLIKNLVPNTFGLAVSDVFTVVYDTVLGTAFFIGEQCLGPAYLPVFTSARTDHDEKRAWQYTSILFNFQFFILLGIIALLIIYPQPIIGAFTQWDPPAIRLETREGKAIQGNLLEISESGYLLKMNDQEVRVAFDELSTPRPSADEIAAKQKDLENKKKRNSIAHAMLPYIAPGLLGMSLASLTYVILNGYKEFFFAAFGDTVLKLCIMGGALAAHFIKSKDWRWIAAGAVAGGTLKLGIHLFALGFKRVRMYSPFALNLADPYVRSFFLLVLPLLAGIFLSRGRDAVMVNVLTSQEGLPTYFSQGRGLIDSFSFLVPYALSIALLPFFCDISARNDQKQLGEVLTKIIRMLVWFFVPLCIALAAAALPTCLLAYKGAEIDAQRAGYSAVVLQIFCIQLPFQAIEMMTMQAFFSSRRVVAPTVAGLLFSMVSPVVAYHLVIGKSSDPYQILLIVSLCYVSAKVLKSLVLVGLLKWTVPVLPFAETAGYGVKLAIAGAGSAAAAWGTQMALAGPLAGVIKMFPGQRIGLAVEATAIGIAGAAVYLALSLLIKMEEPHLCFQWAKEKIRMRGKKTGAPPLPVDSATST